MTAAPRRRRALQVAEHALAPVMSLSMAVLFAAVATVALGGELSRGDLFRLLSYGALSVVVAAGGATAVAAGGVLIGRSWDRR